MYKCPRIVLGVANVRRHCQLLVFINTCLFLYQTMRPWSYYYGHCMSQLVSSCANCCFAAVICIHTSLNLDHKRHSDTESKLLMLIRFLNLFTGHLAVKTFLNRRHLHTRESCSQCSVHMRLTS